MQDDFVSPTGAEPPIPGNPVTDTGAPPAPPRGRRSRAVVRASLAAAILIVGVIGGVIGHVAWQPSPQSSRALTSTGGSSGSSSGSSRSGSGYFGQLGNGGGFSFQVPGVNTGNSGNTAGGSTSTALGAPSNASSIAQGVQAGLVDIDTDLGYENGEAAGTGMVLTSNGEVLTNNHVIMGATTIRATDIGNGKTYSAKVVGYDHTGDVAVIQLKNASGLQTVSLGDSSAVKVGDAVVGIGNAGGVGGTPSYAGGSITAVKQSITASDEASGSNEHLQGLLGTNANIEAGDSGGPLVNASGQVIGMDTAGSSGGGFTFDAPSGDSTQGYAIPIDTALSIAQKIEAGKSSTTIHIGTTAFIGVDVETTSNVSNGGFGGGAGGGGYGYGNGNGYGFGNTGGNTGTTAPSVPASGAYIEQVVPNSPASRSGLVAGDTIVSIGGKAVTTPTTLTQIILGKKPGQSVSIGYIDSSGTKQTGTITFGSGPAQ